MAYLILICRKYLNISENEAYLGSLSLSFQGRNAKGIVAGLNLSDLFDFTFTYPDAEACILRIFFFDHGNGRPIFGRFLLFVLSSEDQSVSFFEAFRPGP